MKIIEFLASQLDREITQYDTQRVFTEDIEFWNLCLEAKRILMEEELAREDKNATNIAR